MGRRRFAISKLLFSPGFGFETYVVRLTVDFLTFVTIILSDHV